MKSSLIIQEAKEVKAFVEKNKKLPSYCTINGNQYSIYTTSYLFAKLLSKPSNSSINLINASASSTQYKGNISEKVLTTDYRDMVQRFVSYVEKNKRVPSYVTTVKSKTKVQYDLFVYCLCKIIVFYYNNSNTFPAYCLFNSKDIQANTTTTKTTQKTTSSSTSTSTKVAKKNCKNPYTSTTHYLSSGCNKLGQCTGWWCAPHAIRQSMRKFGVTKYTEKQIAGWAGTTTAGTGHSGINTAIAKIAMLTGKKFTVKWKNFSDMGSTDAERFSNIAKLLCKDNTAIILHIAYINGGNGTSGTHFGHYEYLDKINTTTKYVRALNSLGTKKSDGSYTGKLQDRAYSIQAYFAKNTPGNQSALCIITQG